MPLYKVVMNVTYQKELKVFARDEDEAKEKSEDIVNGWNNVHACEAQDADVALS